MHVQPNGRIGYHLLRIGTILVFTHLLTEHHLKSFKARSLGILAQGSSSHGTIAATASHSGPSETEEPG